MFRPRRLSFQLTSLLDLLLIVIFAQFLEVRETDARRETQARLAQARLEEESARLTQQQQELQATAVAVEWRLERAGDVLGDVLNLPDSLIDQVIRQQSQRQPPPSPAEQEELRERLRNINRLRGRELIRHLLTYEELRKRSDIWEVHVRPGGLVRFRTSAGIRTFEATTSEQFIAGIYAAYRDLPEPKGLVILLFSYGDIRVGQRRAALTALPEVTGRMQRDTMGRTRFEYAVLGYEPQWLLRREAPGASGE